MNENRKLIEKLIPYISSSNPIRRTGVINMVRNILLDDYYWDKLVDNWNTNGYLREIVYRVCANLNGNHIIEKHEVDPMITSLKKEREKVCTSELSLKSRIMNRTWISFKFLSICL